MRRQIKELLEGLLQRLKERGEIRTLPSAFMVEVPKSKNHGHYSTNVAMAMASTEAKPPRAIAQILLQGLKEDLIFERVEIAGPGFINFWVKKEALLKELLGVLRGGEEYLRPNLGHGKRVVVEFVSANPTGPLHLGHGRGAAVGDSLCRLLEFCGYEVTREFYINDAGRQIRLLGQSIYSRYKQREVPSFPFPEDGYHGGYIEELLESILEKTSLEGLSPEEAMELCSKEGMALMLKEIKSDLDEFRVRFDVWTSEYRIQKEGALDQALNQLKERNFLYEEDGALWVSTTAFGDDKDRVIRKSDGEYTYFASDIAYHLDKWKRGFEHSIDIWGADHHGYVPRIKSVLECYGIDREWLRVLLIQLVKLFKGKEEIKMSKRAGSYVTLRELINEVGVDAARFVFLTKHHDSPLDIDMELVKKQDSENPVYYVQYAHARSSSILRKAPISCKGLNEISLQELLALRLNEELELIRAILDFPVVLEDACASLEPHRIIYYLMELAALFHRYFNLGNKDPELRVIVEDPSVMKARLALVLATRTVLKKGLELVGVSAPESM